MFCLSQGYMGSMVAKGVPEDMKGKDKIVFGNIHQIYDWHKEWVYLCLCDFHHIPKLSKKFLACSAQIFWGKSLSFSTCRFHILMVSCVSNLSSVLISVISWVSWRNVWLSLNDWPNFLSNM